MGSEVVADSASREGGEGNLAPISYTQIFESHLPFYLSIGMTWDEFWNDDVDKAKYYRKAFELKRRYDNENNWRLGAYFLQAINVAFSDSNSHATYMDEPFPLTQKEAEEQAQREEIRKAKEMQKAFLKMAEKLNAARGG